MPSRLGLLCGELQEREVDPRQRAGPHRGGGWGRGVSVAKLRSPQAAIEGVDFRHKRGLSRSSFLALARCEWIGNGYNLLLTGKTGLGKTWLACALGQRACREGYSVRYLRLPSLFDMMKAARGDGSTPRLIERL